MCLKKKLLLIIFMTFICFLFINISETKAYSGNLVNGGVFTFPDNYYNKIQNWKNTNGAMYCMFTDASYGYILTQEEINETGYNINDLKLYLEEVNGNICIKSKSISDIRVEFLVCNLWTNSTMPHRYTEKYGQAVKDLYWQCLFDNEYRFYSDFDIYTDSSCTELFYKSTTIPSPFIAPSLYPNSSENESVLNSLKTGEFTFFIVSPRFS